MMRQTLRRNIGDALGTVLAPLPLNLWQRAFPKNAVSLCYHTVSDVDLPHLKLFRYKTTAQFRADLQYIQGRSLSYEELRAVRLGEKRGEPNRVFLTFDDGLVQCYDTIRPLLLLYAVDAAFFIPTRFIGDASIFHETVSSLCIDAVDRLPESRCAELFRAMAAQRPVRNARAGRRRLTILRLANPPDGARGDLLTWILDLGPGEDDARARLCDRLGIDVRGYLRQTRVFMGADQIRALAADGFTVGAHGIGHDSLETQSTEDIVREIVTSCSIIREITGKASVPFAFPYSGFNVDRGLLHSLQVEHPFIDLFFDSGSLREEPPIVVSRVFADDPMTTVARAFSRAWAKPSAWYANGK